MKLLTIIFLLLLIQDKAQAGLSKLKRAKLSSPSVTSSKLAPNAIVVQKVSLTNAATQKSPVEVIKSETDRKNAELVESFLNSRKIGITDNTTSMNVPTGATFKGIILNSIVSSNLDSPIVVEISDNQIELPANSRFICTGFNRGKRVLASCSRLVTETDEYEISASLLNTDGTAGLTGVVYTGKEEAVIGAMVGGGISAALDVSRDRISTISGEMTSVSGKNKVLSGAMGGLDEAVSILGEEAKNKETKISIEAGKEVLVYFKERFKI